MNHIEYIVLSQLFMSSKGLDSYTLLMKTKVNMSSLISCMLSLSKKGYVSSKDGSGNFFYLSNLGKEALLFEKRKKSEKSWREVPKNYLLNKDETTLYIPSVSKLCSKTFKTERNDVT